MITYDLFSRAHCRVRTALLSLKAPLTERGEGVISAAIAVLIMAFLGAGMWMAFNNIFQNTAKNT